MEYFCPKVNFIHNLILLCYYPSLFCRDSAYVYYGRYIASNPGRKVVDMLNLKFFMKSLNSYVTPFKIEIIHKVIRIDIHTF
jgi:hypothetical protein